MMEAVGSLHLFRDPALAALHLPWVEEVRGRLSDLDLLPLLSLLPTRGYMPDFVTPPPESALVRFEDELERVAATPTAQVRKELGIFESQHGRFPVAAEPLRRDPRRELPKLVKTIGEYWRRAVEPYWPRLLALLSADLRYRAKQLTEGGPAALFDDLNPLVRLEGEWVHVDQAW